MRDDLQEWRLRELPKTRREQIRERLADWYAGPGLLMKGVRAIGFVVQLVVSVVTLIFIGALLIDVVDQPPPDTSRLEREAEEDYAAYQLEMARDDGHLPSYDEIRATEEADFTRYMWEEERKHALARAYEEGQWAASDALAIQDPGLVDCEEFSTREEATAFYEGAGGPEVDYFWLDDDRDGQACEALPSWNEVHARVSQSLG